MEPSKPHKGLGAIVENDEAHQTEITVGQAIEASVPADSAVASAEA